MTQPEPDRFVFRPIGVIRTPYAEPAGTPIQGALAAEVPGTVEVDPALADGLADLDGFSHVILLYAFHRSEGFALTVTPYLDDEQRGLFATRAPRRPNPIGLTVVRLRSVEGTTLHVAGVDMLDGTPLLDIKPYTPTFDAPPDPMNGWMATHLDARARGATVRDVADERFHGEAERKRDSSSA